MKPIRWSRALLLSAFAASLVANFFALGYIVKNQREVPAISVLAEGAFSAYPADVRREFRRLLRENRPRTVAALRDLRDARSRLAALASVQPVDEVEVTRAMEDVRAATAGIQRLMQEFLLQALQARAQSAESP